MWNAISIVILIIEALMIAGFIIGRFQKRRFNETASFICIVLLLNYSLHLVPYLYGVLELGEESNVILGLLGCLGSSIKFFVGEPNVEAVEKFTDAFTHFSVAYMLGVVVSLLTTISTAIEVFSTSIVNSFRLSKAMGRESCDIVLGNSPKALHYTKTCNAVLLLDDSVGKDVVTELIEDGYAVLRKGFTVQLLRGRRLNAETRYNVICTESDKALDYIDVFITYKKTEAKAKNVYLYIELDGEKAETVRREIIEKNGMEAYIDTFCTRELMARTFVEENPVTKYLPKSYVQDAAIKNGTEINVFLLGFSKHGKELYRQSVMNNQLVTFDGEYRVLPINYYLCDRGIDSTEWSISGLTEALGELDPAKHFPLIETPFKTRVVDKAPTSREVLTAIKAQVKRENSYTFVIIDTDEDCRNIEISARLKTLLFGADNYHIFVRSEAAYTKDDDAVTYFGNSQDVFNHDVIVNDSLAVMAKKLNEVYTAQHADAEERKRADFAEYIQKKAEKDWNGFDYFTMYSNIYCAMSLRVKLNLLGLDYVKDGKGAGVSLIKERNGRKDGYAYSEYAGPSVRNALIAQEHARWNAYHLLSEYLPLEKEGITVMSDNGKKVRFNVKNLAAKKHACLTSYKGLSVLSAYLAEKAGRGCTAADYDYYIHDEMLIISAEELLTSLGYSVTEK